MLQRRARPVKLGPLGEQLQQLRQRHAGDQVAVVDLQAGGEEGGAEVRVERYQLLVHRCTFARQLGEGPLPDQADAAAAGIGKGRGPRPAGIVPLADDVLKKPLDVDQGNVGVARAALSLRPADLHFLRPMRPHLIVVWQEEYLRQRRAEMVVEPGGEVGRGNLCSVGPLLQEVLQAAGQVPRRQVADVALEGKRDEAARIHTQPRRSCCSSSPPTIWSMNASK